MSYEYDWKPPTEYGWICPRCETVHAPWVSECNCSKEYHITTTPNIEATTKKDTPFTYTYTCTPIGGTSQQDE